MLKKFVLILGLFFCTTVQAQNANDALNKVNRKFFIENRGQWHSDVLYLCRMGGLDAWITKYGVNYTFYKVEKTQNAKKEKPHGKFDYEDMENSILLGHRVLYELQNHNAEPQREGKQRQEGYYNYLIGNDPSKHASYVGLYKEAVVKNVYNGIDIRYYFDKGYLRYDYVVHPDADPSQIKFKLRGQYKDEVKDGKIIYTTCFGEVQLAELHTYQNNTTIQSKFVKQGDVYTFALGNYDHSKDLIIDPLVYSTYIGGSSNDYGYGIAVDGSGNAYVTGWTQSTDYDVTAGAFQTTKGGLDDVFVTKLNATGTALVYSTYIGGNDDDQGYGIAVDGSGNAYVTGRTGSTDYNVTAGAFQTTKGGNDDVFVTKLNATGTALVYSTYIGGSGGDRGWGIAVDGSGNAYVTGFTYSTDYDVTAGAFQTTFGGSADVFVTKLNATGTALVYSTYIGGSDDDRGYGIAVDGSGNAYVTGWTQSTDYDVTAGAFQTTNGGSGDVFVTKLNPTGTALVYSTYIGGSGDDQGYGIALDVSGNAYVTGLTGSLNYDVTPGAFQTTNGGGAYDVFVTKLNDTGTGLLYSTYIGGSDVERGTGIAVDGSGHAYVTGTTHSTDYDVTTGAFQTTFGGSADVFVTQLNPTGTALVYSTYIGGSSGDVGNGIAVDGNGHAYVTGLTYSTNYDVTTGAFQTTFGGGADVFVTKLDIGTTTSVQDNIISSLISWSIYPNPNQGQFTIQTEKGGVFELMDITGKVINTYTITNNVQTLNVNLPAGMYFIRERKSGNMRKLVIN